MKRFLIALTIVLILPFSVFAVEETSYDELLSSYDLSMFDSELNEETKELLSELGLDDFDYTAVSSLSFQNVCEIIGKILKGKLETPLKSAVSILVFILLSALFKSLRTDDSEDLGGVYSTCAALLISVILVAKMSPAQINITLGKCSGYAQLSADEREYLRKYWEAWLKSKDKLIPCGIIPKETTVEELKAYAVLDNSGFGKWQWDMLANEWDAEALTEWGVDLPIMESEIDTDEFFDDLDDDGNKDKGDKITVTIPLEMKDQKDDIKSIIEGALSDYSGIKVK